jgi:DNA-binding NarL/FixJ family response regulator
VAAGARPRRDLLTGPEALTPAEYRVAALAAAGHGNREIAEQLYVTLRTVETHLTHAFQKLGITARTELAGQITPAS